MPNVILKCPNCGNTERKSLPHRNRRLAESHADWMIQNGWVCSTCYAEAQKEESKAAAYISAKEGLPPLNGSEKQVQWGETLRRNMMEWFAEKLRDFWSKQQEYCKNEEDCEKVDLVVKSVKDKLTTKTDASWWITHRDSGFALFDDLIKEAVYDLQVGNNPEAPNAPDQALIAEALAEATLIPESSETTIAAEITSDDNTIKIKFAEKREDFRLLVRSLGYKWNGEFWCRTINSRSGPLDDRLAEAGNKILDIGIPVRIFDADLRSKAINADFAPEQKRWVQAASGNYKEYLAFSWAYEDKLYDEVRRLPGSRWANPYVMVPVSSFDAVLDFVDDYGFMMTDAAKEALEVAQRAQQDALVVRPATAPTDTQPKKPEMTVPEGIDPELVDA